MIGHYVFARIPQRWVKASYHQDVQPLDDLRDLALHALREQCPVRIVVARLADVYARWHVLTVSMERITLVDEATNVSRKAPMREIAFFKLADDEEECDGNDLQIHRDPAPPSFHRA